MPDDVQRKINQQCFAVCAFLLGALGLRAEVKLPSLFSDGMVLQQGMKVNIWGTADPGERVKVTLGDQQANRSRRRRGPMEGEIGAA